MNNDFYYEAALAASERGEYKKAIALYTKAIELDPNDDQSFNNRGACYLKLKDYKKANADFSKAIEINPLKAKSYSNMAGCLQGLGELEKALEEDTKAVEFDPHSAITLNNRGYTLLKLERFDDAITDFNRAINLRPDYLRAYHNRGIAYLKKGEFEKAILDFDEGIKESPNEELYQNRGEAYFQMKEYACAIRDWETAIKHDPSLNKILKQKITDSQRRLNMAAISSEIKDDASIKAAYYLADRGDRLLAITLDELIILGPAFLLFIVASMFAEYSSSNALYAFAALYILSMIVIQAILVTTKGQTIGKKALKIRIVRFADETNPGFLRGYLLRSILATILHFVPGFILLDPIFIFSKKRRCIHDYIAGTKVVDV
jgi:tetratricopeptide (TPR) repeat protein